MSQAGRDGDRVFETGTKTGRKLFGAQMNE